MKNILTCILFNTFILTCASAQLNLVQPGEYYADVDTNLRKKELKTALHNVIKDHKDMGYSFVKTIFLTSDEDPNNSNNLILVYTGRSIAKTTDYSSLLNREHVWAKSHGDFGTSGPGSDAHNLKPSVQSVNADRGNKDFDWGTTYHSEATECKYTADAWEPRDAVKGDIARIMFYMATRYEGENGEPDLELVDYIPTSGPYFGKLSTLIEWNNSDTVNAFERNRNEVIYSYQNNRNPFIDNPQWVNQIWGSDTIVETTSIDTTVIDTNIVDTTNIDSNTNYFNNSFKTFDIFPNPATDYLKITTGTTIAEIRIYNTSGLLIASYKDIKKEDGITISGIEKGVYILQITTLDNKLQTRKIIVE